MNEHINGMVDTIRDLESLLEDRDAEIKQLHLTIARQTEAHQAEMQKEIGYLQKRLDALSEKIENYTQIITIHKNMGGNNE